MALPAPITAEDNRFPNVQPLTGEVEPVAKIREYLAPAMALHFPGTMRGIQITGIEFKPLSKELPLQIDNELYAQLEKLADTKHKTVLKFILDAVSLQLWVDDTLDGGGKIIAKPKRGKASILTARP